MKGDGLPEEVQVVLDHEYCRAKLENKENATPPEIFDHTYSRIPHLQRPFMLEQQFADDIGWLSVSKCRTDVIKEEVPTKLIRRNLKM